jgi:hypothetical protein
VYLLPRGIHTRMSFLKNPSTITLLLASLQVLCATYFLYVPNFYSINSLLFLLAGIGITICLMKISPLNAPHLQIPNRQLLLKLVFVILLLPISYQLARHIMDQTPLQIEYADMLPIIKTMCKRFLSGEWNQVYQPIPEIWNGVHPIYLPALWLPFTSSLIFDFDLRWITVCGIWLSILLCLFPTWKIGWRPFFFVITVFTLLVFLHFDTTNNVIRLTEEGVIFFYYALLTVAIVVYNPWFLGTAIALCMLSRYSFIGWIPFAVLFLLFRRQYGFLVKASATTALITFLILIVPFGTHPLLFHLRFQQDYILQATKVWRENPEFFYHSLGMAKFFGPNHIGLIHWILLGGTFLLPLIFLFVARKKILTQPNILLAGFQLSITFFYNFIDVSYLYLFYTPVFVSLAIAGWSLAARPLASSASPHTLH